MSAADVAPPQPMDVETGQASSAGVNLPPDPATGKGFLKPIPETTTTERLAGGAAGVAVITALIAMILEGGIIVVVAGILSVVVGPYAYYQQTMLTDIKALQETEAKISIEVDRLQAENKRLAHSIGDLTTTVDDLKEVEDALEMITSMQGNAVKAFADQVDQARQNLARLETSLKSDITSNLISLIFASDKDNDAVLDLDEVEPLITRINNLPGVEVHAQMFRDATVGKPINAVCDVISNLMKADDIPEEERIFVIHEE
jgi:uncharacterized protein YukE